MMTPSQLADLVRRSDPQGEIDERHDALSFAAALGEPALRAEWLALVQTPPSFATGISIKIGDSDGDLEDDRPIAPGDRFQIRVAKRLAPDILLLFFSEGYADNADAHSAVGHVRVADMPTGGTFTTYRTRFETWTEDAPVPFAPLEKLPDPRTFASDFTQLNVVPQDIRPWLLGTAPETESAMFAAWRLIAVRKLLASLADRVCIEEGQVIYAFSGPPACKVALGDADAPTLFGRVTEGAVWVYAEGLRDADTRHLLLANEWARTGRKAALADMGQGSLESAKGAYSAYVKAGSKETLKALAELRKSIVDETQKISQRAQDLIGAMWKDVAVAAAPFALKIFPDAGKAETSCIASGLAIGAALFLIFSYVMQWHINAKWFEQQKNARDIWKSQLNLVLDPNEVDALSDPPVNASVKSYKNVRGWVGGFYAILVILLILFAFSNRPGAAASADSAAALSAIRAGSTDAAARFEQASGARGASIAAPGGASVAAEEKAPPSAPATSAKTQATGQKAAR